MPNQQDSDNELGIHVVDIVCFSFTLSSLFFLRGRADVNRGLKRVPVWRELALNKTEYAETAQAGSWLTFLKYDR